jgi:site-specific DNA-cytosine methylase
MGWEAAFFSEIEKFPCAVLEHRYPDVPLHGDFTTIKENEYGKIDLLVGGTPCQSFSVAGLRGGLDDDRGNLALEFCRLAQREQPRWIVWENVPGVLSSSGGRDFGSILGALEDIGYGLAYRVLDAQYFGVAQRRRRVFVVGYLGDWRPAAAVLFERHSMSGHSAPSREKRQEATDTAATGTGDSGGDGRARPDLDTFECGGIGSYSASDNSSPLLRTGADLGPGCEALIASTFNEDGTARTLTARYDSSPCVDRGPDIVAVNINGGEPRLSDVVGTLDCWSTSGRGSSQQLAVLQDAPDVVGTLRAKRPGEGGIQGDFDHIVPVVSPALNTQSGSHHAPDTKAYVAFTARDYGADATENLAPTMRSLAKGADGHQSGSHGLAVAYPINSMNAFRSPDAAASTGLGVGDDGEAMYTLTKEHNHAVAFDTTQVIGFDAYNNDVTGDVTKTIDTGADYHHVPIAFSSNMSVPDCQTDGTTPTLKLGGHGGDNPPAVAYDHPGRFNNIHGGSGEHQDVMPTLEATNPKQIVAHTDPAFTDVYNGSITGEVAATMGTSGSPINSAGPQVMQQSTVRRLTPVECERLQGFPDNFTAIPWRKKGAEDCPDGPRYKALGNSMAVPVMRWIGERINLIDDYLSII